MFRAHKLPSKSEPECICSRKNDIWLELHVQSLCINDDLDLFAAWSNLVAFSFKWNVTVTNSFNEKHIQEWPSTLNILMSENFILKGLSTPAPGLDHNIQTSFLFDINLLECMHSLLEHAGTSQ